MRLTGQHDRPPWLALLSSRSARYEDRLSDLIQAMPEGRKSAEILMSPNSVADMRYIAVGGNE